MPTRVLHLAAALALVLLSATAAHAQSNIIRGKVRTPSGSTLNNAIVELRMGGGGIIGQTVTRNDGDFAFTGLVSGEYEIAVTLAGYEPAVQMTRFNNPARDGFAEVVSVEVTLRAKAKPATAAPGTNFAQDVPKAARAVYERALAQLREGKADVGIASLREAIGIFNEYFDAHFALGLALYRAGKYDDALQPLERARQINDRASPVYHLFGLVMVKQKKFAVAEYAFREAIRLNPSDAESRMYRGLVLVEFAARNSDDKRRMSDLAEAERELNRALELDGKLGAAYLQRALLRKRRGDREGAARDLESYLSIVPNDKNAAAIREEITKLRGEKR